MMIMAMMILPLLFGCSTNIVPIERFTCVRLGFGCCKIIIIIVVVVVFIVWANSWKESLVVGCRSFIHDVF